MLELPLGAVSQCVLPGTSTTKTEVELQFIETDAADRDEDALVEVRACVMRGAAWGRLVFSCLSCRFNRLSMLCMIID